MQLFTRVCRRCVNCSDRVGTGYLTDAKFEFNMLFDLFIFHLFFMYQITHKPMKKTEIKSPFKTLQQTNLLFSGWFQISAVLFGHAI